MIINDTIIAAATNTSIPVALNIIRLSGPLAKDILAKLTHKKIESFKPRKTHLVKLYDDKKLLDEAVVVLFEGKESFCGEDTVEFYVHGSPIIAQSVIEAGIKNGARLALKGEFSYKAVINGKMSLPKAEMTNALIHAPTMMAERKALEALGGEFTNSLIEIKDLVSNLYAYCLTALDYPEEFDEDQNIPQSLKSIEENITSLYLATRRNCYLFNGIKIAIVGEPNVGKSTLLNEILGEDKAIVTPIQGTTRDIVEGQKEIDGFMYHFFDTAGIHESDDVIEKMGIDKSLKAIDKADLVLLLSETGFDNEVYKDLISMLKSKPHLKVLTKADLSKDNKGADIAISALKHDLKDLYKKIEKTLDVETYGETGFFSVQDKVQIEKLLRIIKDSKVEFETKKSFDLLSMHLKDMLVIIGEILGESYDPEGIYDLIFSSFCVGK